MARLSPEAQLALIEAHRALTQDTRGRVLRALQAVWGRMDSWSDEAADRMVAAAVPVSIAGQRRMSAATSAYLAAWLGRPVEPVDFRTTTGAAVRNGALPAEVYRRPVIESRATFALLRDIDRQRAIDEAIDAGLKRLLGTASTDLQLSANLTSQQVLRSAGVRTYRRVTTAGACPLCVVASDRVYHVADLQPIHTGCSCGVVPGGDLPEALRRDSNADDPTGGRGLRIDDNDEIGPVLDYADNVPKARRAKRRRAPGGRINTT